MQEEKQNYKVKDLVGVPTDYSDDNNWVHLPENTDKAVDTFFIYPTVYINLEPDAPAIVPVDDPMLRAAVTAHYGQAPFLFEDLTNLYEPYYRQSNLCALMGKGPEEIMAFQFREQRTDVYAALDYFFENLNEGRPFILAGHSQGSVMLKIALRDYFLEHTDYLERMVAAYVIGFSITPDDFEANTALKFAEGADDTGVIVSWNTEGPANKDDKNAVVLEGAMSINPINWKRDETFAPASENLGDRIPVMKPGTLEAEEYIEHKPGLANAQIDLERGTVICTTLEDQYAQPLVPEMGYAFGHASLHLVDYTAFWQNIRENVQTRIDAYLNK